MRTSGHRLWLTGRRYPGDYRLAGTVIDNSSAVVPFRRVAILDRATMIQVGLVIGDATSAWEITGLSNVRRYVAVVTDPTETYNAARHDNVEPVS